MAEYRLTQRARADLIDIYDFTEGKFGAYQAEAYHAGLVRSFGLLADFPLVGQTIDELAAGYRRFRFQSHLIFTLCIPTTSKFVPWFTAPKTSDRTFSSRLGALQIKPAAEARNAWFKRGLASRIQPKVQPGGRGLNRRRGTTCV